MLAQIAAEIHTPDLAVGNLGGTGVAVSGYDEDYLFGSAHHHAEDADLFVAELKSAHLSCTRVHVLEVLLR